MAASEGVIKFNLDYQPSDPIEDDALAELIKWRDEFHGLGAIGYDPQRYDGYAFGNISCRVADSSAFIISGTQTGKYPAATRDHFVLVESCDQEANRVVARGPIKPSSESLAHGAIYLLNPGIRCVVHGHLPGIWTAARRLQVPVTPANIEYGTPAMARALADMYQANGEPESAIVAMMGHEHGVIVYGRDFYFLARRLKELLGQLQSRP